MNLFFIELLSYHDIISYIIILILSSLQIELIEWSACLQSHSMVQLNLFIQSD